MKQLILAISIVLFSLCFCRGSKAGVLRTLVEDGQISKLEARAISARTLSYPCWEGMGELRGRFVREVRSGRYRIDVMKCYSQGQKDRAYFHEVGHWKAHFYGTGEIKDMGYDRGTGDPEEYRADQFATLYYIRCFRRGWCGKF